MFCILVKNAKFTIVSLGVGLLLFCYVRGDRGKEGSGEETSTKSQWEF